MAKYPGDAGLAVRALANEVLTRMATLQAPGNLTPSTTTSVA
jgi:hypothetical protein